LSGELVAHVCGLLEGLGQLKVRPMFGGHGLYSGGVFFGFVLDDVLYLKADDASRPRFIAARQQPFVWNKRPSRNYYRAPPEALESPAEALDWAREALGAALRSKRGKKKR
jgi:DNA transformation protein and related proteins